MFYLNHSVGCLPTIYKHDYTSRLSLSVQLADLLFLFIALTMCFHWWPKPLSSKTQVDVEFSGDKPCSIVIGKCRSINTTPFSVSKASDHPKVSTCITSINSRPIKFLGHIIHGSILYYYSFYLAKSTYFKKIKKINMI